MRTIARSALSLALVLLATTVHAGSGVNLRWDQCLGDAGPANKNFACNTNAGSELIVGSFATATNIADVTGLEIIIDMGSAGASWPTWWQFKNAGSCRIASLNMNLNPLFPSLTCPDWAMGNAVGGIGAYSIGNRGPNTTRIVMAAAVPPAALQLFTAGSEYWGFELLISHAKTVGADACAGCSTPVCLVLKSVNVTTPIAANNRLLTGPSNGTDSDFCTWQGGGGVVVGGGVGCPAATPTRNTRWGELKALYR